MLQNQHHEPLARTSHCDKQMRLRDGARCVIVHDPAVDHLDEQHVIVGSTYLDKLPSSASMRSIGRVDDLGEKFDRLLLGGMGSTSEFRGSVARTSRARKIGQHRPPRVSLPLNPVQSGWALEGRAAGCTVERRAKVPTPIGWNGKGRKLKWVPELHPPSSTIQFLNRSKRSSARPDIIQSSTLLFLTVRKRTTTAKMVKKRKNKYAIPSTPLPGSGCDSSMTLRLLVGCR